MVDSTRTTGISSHHAVTPAIWGGTMSAAPTLSSETHGWSSAMLRHWRGTSPDMEQPPLDQHYVVLHLGGAKRVHRRSATSATMVDVGDGSLTTVAAGHAYLWRTEGPIEFAHLYLPTEYFAAVAAELGEGTPERVILADRIGTHSDRLATFFRLMLAEVESARPTSLFLMDVLLHGFAVELVRHHSTLIALPPARRAMAPHRLHRVLDHIEAHYATDLRLTDLAAVAGTSPYHFSRAFCHETGAPPYRYLVLRRVMHARALLVDTALPIAEIAERCGFHSPRQFAIAFRQHTGVSPSGFRRDH